MAIAKFCAGHWATMAHEEEAPYPAEDATCDFCGKPAARAAGHEPEPVPRGQLADGEREKWTQPADAELKGENIEVVRRVARKSERP